MLWNRVAQLITGLVNFKLLDGNDEGYLMRMILFSLKQEHYAFDSASAAGTTDAEDD